MLNKHLFLIRHAHVSYYTELGQKYRVDKFENHLTPFGWLQALELDYNLHQSGLKYSHIFSSDLARAVQTIAPFATRSELMIQKRAKLREVTTGATYREWESAAQHDKNFAFTGGETANQVLERFGTEIHQILSEVEFGENSIVVSHGAIMETWFGQIFPQNSVKMTWPDVYELVFDGLNFTEINHRTDIRPENASFPSDLNRFPETILKDEIFK